MAEDDKTIDGIVRRVDTQPAAAAAPRRSEAPSDPRRPLRLGMLVVLLGLGGFFGWAALAPLDEGVPTPGTVVVESKRKTLQHPTGGIVRELLVREGDAVKTGQVLLRLEPAAARAAREAADAQYLTARASESRLLAEQRGTARIDFHPDLIARASEPAVKLLLETQRQLFESRRKAIDTELAAMREGIAGLEAQLRGVEQAREERVAQISLFEREVASLAPLVEEGLYPRNRHQDIRRQLSVAYASRAEDAANAARIRNQIAETRLHIAQRRQEYRREVETQLTEVSSEARAQAERLAALSEELARTDVRSPADGMVVGLSVHTLGGVISAGEPIMDVVPEGDSLLIETQIPPHLIKHVRPGQPAQLRFTVLDPRHTPVVDGKVVTVSADLLYTPRDNLPYYLARIEVPTRALAELGYGKVQPGMPVDVITITGERTLFNYVIKPLIDRFSLGLKEE
ncbi:HlyD family type I secretion periplasmic adaptor subunit [Quisquiliibacterium transsilvanicum]|uniref:Membrane fusion protein (MFP) family protein n=1 Tax=Quisquiliibacterium transsilvanicum TaxID=1549638 RepID=A0A7W8MAM6_9BURK|nr:HlyD family type I secretion periplasmic adaptor subunit [Quisquiliibacterium transsilvanicum]MBB5273505.1 protease secretion system membrane fusion protein [Quisquiliibacterium transsilvanicum]